VPEAERPSAESFITVLDAPVLPIKTVAGRENADELKTTLRNSRLFYIVIGNTKYLDQATAVLEAATKAGKNADIRLADELRHRELDKMLGQGMHRKWEDTIGGPQIAVGRPCILIGTPVDNEFIANIMLRSELTDQLVTPDYPGPGRGLLLHIWRPFSFDHNSIIVSGSDASGITKAADRLVQILAQ
jgi:hypothetical protein